MSDIQEQMCRAVCKACGENPDAPGDKGSRWQDYETVYAAVMSVIGERWLGQLKYQQKCEEVRNKLIEAVYNGGTSNDSLEQIVERVCLLLKWREHVYLNDESRRLG